MSQAPAQFFATIGNGIVPSESQCCFKHGNNGMERCVLMFRIAMKMAYDRVRWNCLVAQCAREARFPQARFASQHQKLWLAGQGKLPQPFQALKLGSSSDQSRVRLRCIVVTARRLADRKRTRLNSSH